MGILWQRLKNKTKQNPKIVSNFKQDLKNYIKHSHGNIEAIVVPCTVQPQWVIMVGLRSHLCWLVLGQLDTS